MKKTLFSLVFLLTAVAVGAQTINSASFTFTFNGEQQVLNCPASGFTTLDLTGTVAENLKIDGSEVQVSDEVNDVYIVAGEYKDGTSQSDVEIFYVPLTSNGKGGWYLSESTLEQMGNGWIVKDNDRSTGNRNFRFYFVANKDTRSPI